MVKFSLHSELGPTGLATDFSLKDKDSENSKEVLRLDPENLPCFSLSREEHFKQP